MLFYTDLPPHLASLAISSHGKCDSQQEAKDFFFILGIDSSQLISFNNLIYMD